MITYLSMDDRLVQEACQLGGITTPDDAATQALLEYIKRRKQLKLLDLFGTVDYHNNYSIKEQRNCQAQK